jgi:hypothetical protein
MFTVIVRQIVGFYLTWAICRKMDSDDQHVDAPAVRSLIRVVVITPIVSFSLAIASIIALVTFVPRRAEGIRFVPIVDWTTYVLIGNFAPFLLSLITLSFLFRSPRQRIVSWLLAASLCYVLHEMFVTNLLRRDFIGKF